MTRNQDDSDQPAPPPPPPPPPTTVTAEPWRDPFSYEDVRASKGDRVERRNQ